MSEAPDKKSGAFGDKRYKARWVLPRELGGRHIGLYNPFYKKSVRAGALGGSYTRYPCDGDGPQERKLHYQLKAAGGYRMKKRYTREKKTLCGEGYMEIDLYHITPEEHAAKRRKKTRPSSERQKKRNAQHAHRWRVQKANANFTVLGFYLTLTYIDTFLPESMEQAQRDLRNYIRRVKAAIAKLYGADVELRVMGLTGCGRKSGRYHHHLLIECKGLTMRQNADFRQLLEDKWAVRWPDGSVESLGTANADRLNLQNRLDDLITYFEKHGQMRWYETRNLTLPVEHTPNDTRWSRKQLRKGCTDCKDNAYWWEQRYPGWKFVRCVVPEPEAPGDEKEGWDADELRCYVVMVKREGAKVRT